MKKINFISFLIICFVILATSCENDDIESKELDSSLYWVSFADVNISAVENTVGIITAKVSLSADTQNTDVPITYSVSSPDGAVDGVDYTLPAGFGNAVILAGEHFVDIELATLINDDLVEGDKTLVYTLESAGNFNVGLPNTGSGNTYTLTIKEDDFTLIKGTSFEEPVGGTGYNDAVTQDIDHDLTNNPGESPVDYVSTGGEIGFDAIFISTRVFNTPNGLVNEPIGVLNPSPGLPFTDGDQGYGFADNDGTIRVTFDTVDVSGFTESFVSLDVFITATSYETSSQAPDKVKIYVIADGGEVLDILDLEADNPDKELDNYPFQGVWAEQKVDLTGFTTAQLVIEVDVNVNSELILIDNIRFLGL